MWSLCGITLPVSPREMKIPPIFLDPRMILWSATVPTARALAESLPLISPVSIMLQRSPQGNRGQPAHLHSTLGEASFRNHWSGCVPHCQYSIPWPFPFLPAVLSLVTTVSFADESKRPRENPPGRQGRERAKSSRKIGLVRHRCKQMRSFPPQVNDALSQQQ